MKLKASHCQSVGKMMLTICGMGFSTFYTSGNYIYIAYNYVMAILKCDRNMKSFSVQFHMGNSIENINKKISSNADWSQLLLVMGQKFQTISIIANFRLHSSQITFHDARPHGLTKNDDYLIDPLQLLLRERGFFFLSHLYIVFFYLCRYYTHWNCSSWLFFISLVVCLRVYNINAN